MTNCTYSNPLTAGGEIATSTENFAFASSTCVTVTDTISTTTDIAFTNVVSAGVALQLVLLLFILIVMIIPLIAKSLSEIPVFLKRKEK